MRYIIIDWAGNHLSRWGEFKTFEDGWDYILGEMTDLLALTEEDYQEYSVVEKDLREVRLLDPRDARSGA